MVSHRLSAVSSRWLVRGGLVALVVLVYALWPILPGASSDGEPPVIGGGGYGNIDTIAGTGTGGHSGDDGPGDEAQVNNPFHVAVDADGNLYIADRVNHRVRRVDAETGVITTVAGDGSPGYSGDNATATEAQLNLPESVAVGPDGDIYIGDVNNRRIRRVDADTGVITTVAGDGSNGYSGDDGPATDAQLAFPRGLWVDADGNIYIVDYSQHVIRRVDAGTGVITTVAGDGSSGYSGDDGQATDAQLSFPSGITGDADGNLYIADTNNNRVRRVDAGTGVITTVAGDGTTTFSGEGGQATATGINAINGVTLDANGNLLIAGFDIGRVLMVDLESGVITTVAGTGSSGSSGDGGPAAEAQTTPMGIAAAPDGTLYISEYSFHRIRAISSAASLTPDTLGRGATDVTVTVEGEFFQEDIEVEFSGTGVTVSDVQVNGEGTELTLTVSVADDATLGGRDITVTNPDSGEDFAAGVLTITAAPIASESDPSQAPQGASSVQLTVTGAGFADGATVEFSGTGITVTDVTFVSDTELTVTVDVDLDAALGARSVTVTNPDLGVFAAAGLFNVSEGPQPAELSPSLLFRDTQDNEVILTGSGFQDGMTVSIPDEAFGISVQFDSAGQVTLTVDIDSFATTGEWDLPLVNPDGGSFLFEDALTVSAQPEIDSIFPTTMGQGAIDAEVVISGELFQQNPSITIEGSDVTITGTEVNGEGTEITVTLNVAPGAATGALDITVTNPDDGEDVLQDALTIAAGPEVTDVSPVQAPQGMQDIEVTLTGSDFVNGATVAFSGTGVTADVTFDSSNQLTLSVDIDADAATGARSLTVINPDSGTVIVEEAFTVIAAPDAESVAPDAGLQAADGIELTVTGTGFQDGVTAEFSSDSVTITNVEFVSATELTLTVDIDENAAPGARDLTLTNPDEGERTLEDAFTVVPLPALGGGGYGIIDTIAGTGTGGHSGDDGPGDEAQVRNPFHVAVDADGNLYIADRSNHVVRRVDAGTGVITTVAGTGVFGYSGDGELATEAQLYTPEGVAIGPDGDIYIAGVNIPVIRRVDAETGVITTVAGTGVTGYSGDGGQATEAQIRFPRGLWVDADGNIYIVGHSNHVIRRVDAGTGVITTVAGDGSLGYSGDGELATEAQLRSPGGITGDADGNLYIGDTSNNRVRRVDAETGIITTVAGDGSASYASDGVQATETGIGNVYGVALDGDGNLLIAGYGSYRAFMVDLDTGVITTVAGTGTDGSSGDGGPAVEAKTVPTGVAVAPDGTLYISEYDLHRVRAVAAAASLTPDTLGRGATDVTVTVEGEFFQEGIEVELSGTGVTVSDVQVNGEGTELTLTVSVADDATLSARSITVTNPDGGEDFAAGALTITAAPEATSVSPAQAPQGASSVQLTVTGTDFVDGADVEFSGTGITVTNVAFVSATDLTVTADIDPEAATGLRSITVINPDMGTSETADAFTVSAGPQVASVSPARVKSGAEDVAVTINGQHFQNGASVVFDSPDVTITGGVSVNGSGTAIALALDVDDAHVLGDLAFTVTNPDGGEVAVTGELEVSDGPSLTSVSPSSIGRGAQDVELTLTGSGFEAGIGIDPGTGVTVQSGSVSVNGDGTEVTLTVNVAADAATGARPVTVTNTDDLDSTLASAITVTAAPVASSVSPSSRTQSSSGAMTITGSGFQGGMTVSFDDGGLVVSNIVVTGSTQATFTLQANSAATLGAKALTLVNPDDGRSTLNSAMSITSPSPPTPTPPPAATATALPAFTVVPDLDITPVAQPPSSATPGAQPESERAKD